MIMRQNDDRTNLCYDDEKVSPSKNNINMFDVKCELGPSICASVELSDDPGPKLMMSRVSATDDEGGGRVRDDEEDLTVLYSSVHQMSNEKVARKRRWSMKSGLLTRDTIDQKQTSSVTRGGGSNREPQQKLQSKILMWEGIIQRENLADYLAEHARHRQTRGQTD